MAMGLFFGFGVLGAGLYNLCLDRQIDFETKLVELEGLKSERRSLTDYNEVMRDRVAYLKTNEGVEEIAREKLGLIRPGELAYAVVPPPPSTFTEEEEVDAPHLDHAKRPRENQEDYGLIVRVLRQLFGPTAPPEQVPS